MLRELIQAWRGESLQSRMLDEFDEMLASVEWMYEHACDVLLSSEAAADDVLQELVNRDRRVKELEATIRRQLVEHLTIRPGHDVTGSLVMMSVVKDAERIGDFSRKIFKMRTWYERKFEHGDHSAPLAEIREAIRGLFDKVRLAFREGDSRPAEETVAAEDQISAKCDKVIDQLLKDNLPCERAVTYTLLTRYYNRVAAHLANIASTVLVPPHMIDLPPDAKGASNES